MMSAFSRKFRQLAHDPVLRHWLIGRAVGRWPGEPAFVAHQPPYLADALPYRQETSSTSFVPRTSRPPTGPVTLALAGQDLEIRPGDELGLFKKVFDDIETDLSLHRFAWLPAADSAIDPDWVDRLWSCWSARFGSADNSRAWHPYTASERAINILKFARSHGLSGDADSFRQSIALHAFDIAGKLEYFGDHHTSNHLANNGRGLYLIGLWLGLDGARDLGLRILQEEARRIFAASGLLREGSSHYHLLLARNYDEVRAAAHAANRPEAKAFDVIADRALSFVTRFLLPGGLPLVGDISPDLAPDLLIRQLPALPDAKPTAFHADGWLRFDHGTWSGLWYAAPGGWSPMPGHGHQDLGSFELHYGDEPLFVDLGRGAYGEAGEAAFYRSALAHNGITLNDRDPYPPNKPYYGDSFRTRVGGEVPRLETSNDTVTLSYTGNSHYPHIRSWRFEDDRVLLEDRVSGSGQPVISRRLNTTLTPEIVAGGIRLSGRNSYLITSADATPALSPVTRWQAYGRGVGAHQIEFRSRTRLPFTGRLNIQVVPDDA